MAQFTGYAKRPEPKWFYFTLAVLAVITGSILIFGYVSVNRWFEALSERQQSLPRKIEAKPEVKEMTAPAAITKEAEEKIETAELPASGIGGIDKIVFTSKIVNNQPIDDLTEFSLSGGAIYCYTKMSSPRPAPIRHVWIDPNGVMAADIKLNVARSSAYTWSYINMYGAKEGEWEVRVKAEDGSTIASKQFTVRP